MPLQVALIPLLLMYVNGAHWTIPWFDKTITVFPDLDLAGTTTAVWLTHTAFAMPFAIFLLHNYISSLPKDIFESARIDGANHFKIFYKLVLPLSVPVLAAFAIFQFLWTWNDYLIAVTMVGANQSAAPSTVVIAAQTGRVRPVRAPADGRRLPAGGGARWPCSSCCSGSSSAASSPAPSRADALRPVGRRRPTLLADRLVRLGVEEVQVLAGDGDLDVVGDLDPRARAEAGDGVGAAVAADLLGGVGIAGVDRAGVDGMCTISSEPSASTSCTVAVMRRSAGASAAMLASSKSSGRMPTTTLLAVVLAQRRGALGSDVGGQADALAADLHAGRRRRASSLRRRTGSSTASR